jgi:hypothetical protein
MKFEVLVTRIGIVLHLNITRLELKAWPGQPTIYDVHLYVCIFQFSSVHVS